jgi:hypothetical protein
VATVRVDVSRVLILPITKFASSTLALSIMENPYPVGINLQTSLSRDIHQSSRLGAAGKSLAMNSLSDGS